eukprot:2432431-Karenia_brevis.AAC.1
MAIWKGRNWRTKQGQEIRNVDLWMKLDGLLAGRDGGTVRFRKVLAHATVQDVDAGKCTEFDKWGNDNADILAVGGAASGGEASKLGA